MTPLQRGGPLTSADTTLDELAQLRAAVRGSLGASEAEALPSPDAEWRAKWPALAELGIVAFCVGEHAGGFGIRADAAAVVASELGAGLHGSPYAGLTAAAHALGASEGHDELLERCLTGEAIVAWGSVGSDGIGTVDGGGYADALVLTERTSGARLLLDSNSAWSIVRPHSFDASRECVDIAADLSAGRELAPSPVADALFALLLAADTLGGVEAVLDRTVAYAGQRVAFGKSIGALQAVQHRLADHAVRLRGARLVVNEAARLLSATADDAALTTTMAEISAHSCATHILHDLLQLTGAIGFTWEYGLHFYERRVHQNARLRGNPRAAIRALTAIEGWSSAS